MTKSPAPQIIIEAKHLAAACAHARGPVETRTTVPILSTLLLVAENGVLRVTGTNLDLASSSTAPYTGDGALSVCLDANQLTKIATSADPGAQISITSTDDGRWKVGAGRTKYTLPGLKADDFPVHKNLTDSVSLFVDGPEFARAIGFATVATSTEETRYYLTGALMSRVIGPDGAPTVVLVATDGHRLIRERVAGITGADGAVVPDFADIIIPRRALSEIARLAEKSKRLEIHASEVALYIAALDGDGDGAQASATIWTKLIDGTFPDFSRVIPRRVDAGHRIIDRTTLLAAIKRATTIMGGDKSKGLKLSFEGHKLTITARSAEIGDFEEVIDLETGSAAEAVSIGFNGGYLSDALATLPKAKFVRMQIPDAQGPILIDDEAAPFDALATRVLMPLRV